MKFLFFFGIKLANSNTKNILNYVVKNKIKIINCLNPHSYIKILTDRLFYYAFKFKKALNVIDGVGVQFFFLFKLKFATRVTGYDILLETFKNFQKNKFFFLGSTNYILKLVKNRVKKEYPDIKSSYYAPPYRTIFTDKENNLIIKKINRFKPEVLCIGLGAPKQEKWSIRNLKFLDVKLIINIGGALNYYGKYDRPNFFIRRIGLEWLIRLLREPYRLADRTIISGTFFILFLIKSIFIKSYKYFNYRSFIIFDNVNKINNEIINSKNRFIISAFNLNFFISFIKNNKLLCKETFLWADGLFSKLFDFSIIKIPGSFFLREIFLKKHLSKLIILGNYRKEDEIFLKKKFKNIIIENFSLPYGSYNYLIKKMPRLKNLDSSLVLLTLPTPKQEYLASFIAKKYKKAKIICIGGGLSIASGYEKECPFILRKLGFEWLWRLQFETSRRTLRFFNAILKLIYIIFTGNFGKIKIYKIK